MKLLSAVIAGLNIFSVCAFSVPKPNHASRSSVLKMVATSTSVQVAREADVMTLNRFMIEATRANPEKYSELESMMSSIQFACKTIASLVTRSGIQSLTGLQGDVNVQGEEQKKLDVISNDVLKAALRYTGKMGVIASEEEEKPVLVEESSGGKYVATFDPLDGSSNIDASISTGTIFGIFLEKEECIIDEAKSSLSAQEMACLMQTLQPGDGLVAAGYCMYSSSTIMMLTFGEGLYGFTLDPQIGEFVLTHPDVKIPKRGKIYSLNEANEFDWDEGLQKYIKDMKKGSNLTKTKYSARYIGSMVGDVHRTLLYGGLFAYPGDKKNPNGKLRLLYEAAPMSYIIEQAGGKSTTGKQRIMDISPTTVHERCPVFLGSPDDIEELLSYL